MQEELCGGLTDAAGGAGNDRDLAIEALPIDLFAHINSPFWRVLDDACGRATSTRERKGATKLVQERNVIAVRVTPRSAKPGIGQWQIDPGGRPFLEIRVAAAPADGAANDEVVKLLAKALGLAKSSLTILSGQTARLKRIELPLDEQEIRARLSR